MGVLPGLVKLPSSLFSLLLPGSFSLKVSGGRNALWTCQPPEH
jgi:hypothetical protein